MKRILQKLHSRSGASFLFAMLAFMVAAMVAVTIITAATSSMKRVRDDREQTQTHLTLVSAAQLLETELANTQYLTAETTVTSTAEDGTQTAAPGEAVHMAQGPLAREIYAAVTYIDGLGENLSGSGYTSPDTAFTVRVDGADDVDVSFRMSGSAEEKYKLYFTLTTDGGEEIMYLTATVSGQRTQIAADSAAAAALAGFLPADRTQDGVTSVTEIGRVTAMVWEQFRISEAGETS